MCSKTHQEDDKIRTLLIPKEIAEPHVSGRRTGSELMMQAIYQSFISDYREGY